MPRSAVAFLVLAALNSAATASPAIHFAYLPAVALANKMSKLGLLVSIAALGLGTSMIFADRVLRIVVGLLLIGAALGLYGSAYQSAWAWSGVIPLATGLAGWCPLYTVLGIRTCKTAATQ